MTWMASRWTRVGAAVLVVAGAVVAGVALAPVVQGQTPRSTRAPLTVFSSEFLGGSEIGATVRDLAAGDVTRGKLASAAGAVVENVRPDSPAARAGLRAGDIVIRFDGETVRSARQFMRLVSETPDGMEVAAVVVRDGAQVTLKVTPSERETFARFRQSTPFQDFQFMFPDRRVAPQPFLREGNPLEEPASRGRLGVEVQELAGQLGDYFGASQGVLVTRVEDGTPAKAAGLRAGDVITKFNDRAVTSPDDLRRRVTGADGEVKITIVRDRREQTLTVKLDDASGSRRIIK